MPKIYEVRTSSGLPVFEGNHFSGCYSVLLESWEQEAYAGGYGADWLENVGESVRVYATECENEGKRPTFAGLIRHLKSLHDEGGGEI